MSDVIKLLPDHVANQIAAGEVVQRPASVVKELLENAIDAKATDIKLIVKDAGKTLIQVIDNGVGMSPTDARLSFERHATSKIKCAEDLFTLQTKGFRGEALASIAAIAHVEMHTKQESNDVGTHIKIEGSRVVLQDVAVTPKGTSIAVKNLFFNIPARRNFLKSDTIELRHIMDEFHRVALAHPSIAFDFFSNNSEVFNLPPTNQRQRIVHIFGSKTNPKLVPVSEDTEVVKISGFIGKPEFSKKTKGEQFFFVNQRFVKSGYLHHAVISAFEGLIKEHMQPSYFLYLNVNPSAIDINIHPTKTEIKFEDEHTLYAMLKSAVKHSLGQFNVAPVLDFERDPNLDIPYHYREKETGLPLIEVDAAFNPFSDAPLKNQTVFKKEKNASWEGLYVGLESKVNAQASGFSSVEFETEEVATSIFDEEGEHTTGITYQLNRKYIVSTLKNGMVVIDQHRAHQRVLYEQFLKDITVKEGVSQQLLFPINLELNPVESHLIAKLKERLESTGFHFGVFAENGVEVTGVPLQVATADVPKVIDAILANFEMEVPESGFSQTDLLAKTMSKALAVKRGEALNKVAMESLVNQLFACKETTLSPYNKLTYITVSVDDLDKKFV